MKQRSSSRTKVRISDECSCKACRAGCCVQGASNKFTDTSPLLLSLRLKIIRNYGRNKWSYKGTSERTSKETSDHNPFNSLSLPYSWMAEQMLIGRNRNDRKTTASVTRKLAAALEISLRVIFYVGFESGKTSDLDLAHKIAHVRDSVWNIDNVRPTTQHHDAQLISLSHRLTC